MASLQSKQLELRRYDPTVQKRHVRLSEQARQLGRVVQEEHCEELLMKYPESHERHSVKERQRLQPGWRTEQTVQFGEVALGK
jgi:hypothetical protein